MLLFFAVLHPVVAQKSRADKLFADKQYYAAAQLYAKELGNESRESARVHYQLNIGVCYLNINRPQAALPWLKIVANKAKTNVEAWYSYGLALQQTGEYKEAIHAFKQCLKLQPSHQAAVAKIASCQFALQSSQINPYTNFRLATEVNTAGSEFGVSPFTNGMVFYSVAGVPANTKIDQRTGLQYVTSYMARLHNKNLVNPHAVSDVLPKYINAGLFAYDSIIHCAYFTYCDPETDRCGIYASYHRNNKWTTPNVLMQNRKHPSTGHPALANGGKRLYFSSNSPDGIGQTDIWYIDRIREDKWSDPVNVGLQVNTSGREEFPFVYADSLLFFASDGHQGFGGLDIFCASIRGNTFGKPVNLKRPYNSPGDDFNLVITGNTGIMSSSRNELVNDDLYLFDGVPSLQYISGIVTDAAGSPLKDVRLTLSTDGKAVGNRQTDSTGYYGFFLKQGVSSMIYVRALGYKPSLITVNAKSLDQFSSYGQHIVMQPSGVAPVLVQLYDKKTGRPVAGRGLICSNNDGTTQIGRTDNAGSFQLVTQENEREYWIKFPDGYYLTESIILNDEQKTYSLGVQSLDDELFVGWLRFKRDSTEPVEMSQPLILRIAAIIKANPGIIFQITGFSDAFSESKITNLAGKRADYIMRRLVEEGVAQNQLAVITNSLLINKNKGVDNEAQNSIERRVEIRTKKLQK